MKTCFFLALLWVSSFTMAQETKTEMQLKIELIDSIAKTTNLIHVFSEVGSVAETDILLTAYSWEFKNGFMVLNHTYFFDISHLAWFRVAEQNNRQQKVLQLYFN